MRKISIFIDESGTFERPDSDPLGSPPHLAGFIAKRNHIALNEIQITNKFLEVAEKFHFTSFNAFHAKDLTGSIHGTSHNNPISEILNYVKENEFEIFYMKYKKERKALRITKSLTDEAKKAIRNSRYTRMVVSLVWTLIFHTDFREELPDEIEIWMAERSNFLIDRSGLQGALVTLQELMSHLKTNVRITPHVVNIDHVNELRLRLADFISYTLYRKEKYEFIYEIIAPLVKWDLEYSPLHDRFIEISDLFQKGDLSQAMIQYLSSVDSFDEGSYYQERLGKLYNKCLRDAQLWSKSEDHIERIISKVKGLIRSSSASDSKLLTTAKAYLDGLEKILYSIDILPEVEISPAIKFQVYSQFLSYANHTSDFKLWEKMENKGRKLLEKFKHEAKYYQEIIDFENTYANGMANFYRFEEAIEKLVETAAGTETLLHSMAQIHNVSEEKMRNRPFGKVQGALGQNYAFYGDTLKNKGDIKKAQEYFVKSKEAFEKALTQFERPRDKKFQYINLAHLYLSQNMVEETWEYLKKAAQIDNLNTINLIDRVYRESNRPDLYLFHIILKAFHNFGTETKVAHLLNNSIPRFMKLQSNLEPYSDHPTQLVLIHLAQMQMNLEEYEVDKVAKLLKSAIEICIPDEKLKPALNIMAIKPYLLLARLYYKNQKSKKTQEYLERAQDLFQTFLNASSPTFPEIIHRTSDDDLQGYFAETYDNLKKAIGDHSWLEEPKFKDLMPRYPFNYE